MQTYNKNYKFILTLFNSAIFFSPRNYYPCLRWWGIVFLLSSHISPYSLSLCQLISSIGKTTKIHRTTQQLCSLTGNASYLLFIRKPPSLRCRNGYHPHKKISGDSSKDKSDSPSAEPFFGLDTHYQDGGQYQPEK